MTQNSQWHRFETADDVAEAAYRQILAAAEQAITERGQFKLVLAGGTTPEKVYRMLAASDADWQHWFVYYGDERCLPLEHPDRNSQLAENVFLSVVPIPEEHIFTIPAELGPKEGALRYHDVVANAVPFDMVLLGIGEDGHTASLFPGHQHNLDELTHAVFNSPKPPPERVSVSAKALSDTKGLIFLVTGAGKHEAVKAWRAGEGLPVATILPKVADIFIDAAAYGA